jgi:hypothetical protein
MIAVGIAHGTLFPTHADPEGVAHSMLRCDPFRVGFKIDMRPGATHLSVLAPRLSYSALSGRR